MKNIFEFNFEDLKTLRKIESKRTGSYYAGSVMFWDYDNDIKINEQCLCKLLQVFSRNVIVTDSFIKKYDVKGYHINLIKSMYFNSDDSDNMVTLDYKRPYGNSNVMGDIYDEYQKYSKDIEYDDKYHLDLIHKETMNIFDLMLKELLPDSFEYKRKMYYDWSPTKEGIIKMNNYIRELKFNRILIKK